MVRSRDCQGPLVSEALARHQRPCQETVKGLWHQRLGIRGHAEQGIVLRFQDRLDGRTIPQRPCRARNSPQIRLASKDEAYKIRYASNIRLDQACEIEITLARPKSAIFKVFKSLVSSKFAGCVLGGEREREREFVDV